MSQPARWMILLTVTAALVIGSAMLLRPSHSTSPIPTVEVAQSVPDKTETPVALDNDTPTPTANPTDTPVATNAPQPSPTDRPTTTPTPITVPTKTAKTKLHPTATQPPAIVTAASSADEAAIVSIPLGLNISMDEYCRSLTGQSWVASYPTDMSNPESWVCQSDAGIAPITAADAVRASYGSGYCAYLAGPTAYDWKAGVC